MTLSDPLSYLRDPRLANHAAAAAPAWLWAADGTRVLWANAAGAALLGAKTLAELTERRISTGQPLAAQVVRLAGTLPYGGAARLERLRGIGSGVGRAVACACTRVSLANGTPAVLIASTETVGPALPLAERVARLFAGIEAPLAIFSADGALLHATPAAREQLGDKDTLAALGTDDLAVERVGSGKAALLIVMFDETAPASAEAMDTSPRLRGESLPSGTDPRVGEQSEPGEGDSRHAELVETPPHPDPLPEGHPATHASRGPRSGERETTAAPAVATSTATKFQHPIRFIWQIDASGTFTIDSRNFVEAMGPRTVEALGRPWSALAGALGLDPDGRVEQALASRETWSGIHVAWPIDGRDDTVEVEMSGLPTFDRERTLRGWRGFGVCRDVACLNAAIEARRMPVAEATPSEEKGEPATLEQKPLLTVVPAAANVVPFRGPAGSERRPALSPVERTNFREIAKVLGAEGDADVSAAEREPTAEPPPDVASRAEPDAQVPAAPQTADRLAAAETALLTLQAENRELRSILDTATDGIVVIERDGRIVALSRSAEALFGYESADIRGNPFIDLLAPESHRAAHDYLDGLTHGGVASVLNDGREVIGRVRQGGLVPLFMTMGRIGDGERFCAVLRDITQWKRAEEDLLASKRQAERASSAKSEFLAKISHEIRTPLNAVIGFSEVMMEERFGPIGNDRYREYLKDIHASGGHLVSLINDLLDLSKIEAGKLDLSFASVDLNGLVQQCVALMQPQANRERIIIRTSLAPSLPAVVVDARSIRQIVLNLLSNSIKFTGAGGQVIVSTALTDRGDGVLRVRDTGVGMSEKDIEAALEPFRQLATSSRWGSGGTGLGLPLTKALAEANRATFSIKSAVNAGTLVEIGFPSTRLAAE